jgi:hypothetical protein
MIVTSCVCISGGAASPARRDARLRSVEDAGHRALVAGREQLDVVALPCSSTTERRLQATKEYDLIRLPEEG